MIPAHFTRSFLAQVLGLNVNLSFLEIDEPEFYEQKVKYLLENDIDDLGLDLTFSEEIIDEQTVRVLLGCDRLYGSIINRAISRALLI